ncbi:nitrogenase iron-molybdenum cofactor biosynthesis protein NifB [Gottschalkia acidurici 9a]|uniref:Nitrogenase iron-molybdenum cofactor biosynthesis protein NifB n=1 Tax=Gottschalkia acidurici (strain ATCC 7906 / DSM 604 / BCRC 14475 / CIP 104303 / KCTC 5404 / NCIMB 10678 / 9a) TaxID=1128398 RepID=K0B2J9_GOTA9|nr:NifB/NifX family molybdenum-iron cluster-binding protein [Gottschalkia acidurici]AFS79165.1 nitrogenase iron-molybdenum cofactor biosynthesis protein NifB [Gottschalkia acidurici 9a]
MSIRVAVASKDGKVVNQHFGKANKFYIYNIHKDKTLEYIGVREIQPLCELRGHDQNRLLESIKLISDCEIVLVSAIGLGAENELVNNRIKAYRVYDFIHDSLNKIADQYYQ